MTMPNTIDQAKEDEAIAQFLKSVEGLADKDSNDLPGNLRAMLYGDDGTGKTIAGLGLLNFIVPAHQRIILIDTAQNALSINNHPGLKRSLADGKPRLVRLPYKGEAWLHAFAATVKRRIPPFDNIGGVQFDEFSTMADNMMGVILKVAEDKNPDRPKDDATWPEYKMLARKMKNVIQLFGGLEGVHCTFIAHERTLDKDGYGRPVTKPNFTPSVAPEIRKPMHIITRVSVDENGRRTFQVRPDPLHLAKCKVGKITTKEVEFKELAEKTKGWLEGEIPTEEKETIVPTVVPVTDEETMAEWNDDDV